MTYLPLLIKVGKSGAYSKNMEYEAHFDTKAEYKLWVKHMPFTIMPKIKGMVTHTWKDEDGDDVYLPESGVKYESYELKVDFVYYENDGQANKNIAEFVNRIRGKWLRLYDSYTNTTRDGVYVVEVDSEPRFKRRDNKDIVIFGVTFKVNNPSFNGEF